MISAKLDTLHVVIAQLYNDVSQSEAQITTWLLEKDISAHAHTVTQCMQAILKCFYSIFCYTHWHFSGRSGGQMQWKNRIFNSKFTAGNNPLIVFSDLSSGKWCSNGHSERISDWSSSLPCAEPVGNKDFRS